MGLQNQPFLAKGWWQAQVAYQYASTDQWYFGDQRVLHPPSGQIPAPTTPLGALYGTPPTRKVNIWALDLAYGVTNRLALETTVPFLSGSLDVVQGSTSSHQNYHYTAGGLGDVAVQAEYWLIDPTVAGRINGSVALGIKAPTGSDEVIGTFVGGGKAPIDEGAQLGNGGWEVLLRAQGSAGLGGPFSGYVSGYYGLSLNESSGVAQAKPDGTAGPLRGVPDTYSGRVGLAYLVPVLEGLVLTTGGRINGVTTRDIKGGADKLWRRPGYEVFVEPGLTWTLGRNSASISVPVRVYQRKLDSYLDISLNSHVGSDFVPYLFLASVAHRF